VYPFPRSVRLRGLHAHLASGVGADGLLAAAGRLLSFGRQWCAEQGVTEPEFNLGGGMAVDYTRPDAVFDWPGYGRGLAGAYAWNISHHGFGMHPTPAFHYLP
jgi:diaminopimelate decarboxylase